MSRTLVGPTLALVALVSGACSTHSDPVASMDRSQVQVADTLTRDSFPFAPNVHTAALPTLPATLNPSGFNDFGEVVGASGNQAWHWEGSRGLAFFAKPLEYTVVDVENVNNRGDVAVNVTPDTGTNRSVQAAYFDWFGALHVLRPLSRSTPSCAIKAINDSREAIGECFSGGLFLPTIWTPFGTPVPVEPGGGAPLKTGLIVSLANSGYIFGYDTNLVGFTFSPGRQLQHLRPAMQFITGGLNDNGQVTGEILDGHIPNRPFEAAAAWLSDSARELGINGAGWAISDDSIVVGISDATYGNAFGFVWTVGTGVQRLPGLEHLAVLDQESVNTFRMFMNKKRQILGRITKSDGTQTYVMWTLPATITRGAAPTLARVR
jgi:hypothetical protein